MLICFSCCCCHSLHLRLPSASNQSGWFFFSFSFFCCTQIYFIPSISGWSVFRTHSQRTCSWPLQHIKFYISQLLFVPTLLSAGNIIPIFILCEFFTLPPQRCLLPSEVKWQQELFLSLSLFSFFFFFFCMRSISINSPFCVKSTVNTRLVDRSNLFMKMCSWLQSPNVWTNVGVECTVFHTVCTVKTSDFS